MHLFTCRQSFVLFPCNADSQYMLLAFTQLQPCDMQSGIPDQTCKLCGMQALMSIINDTLGMPLFDTRMAALQLPMSATIHSITEYPGESITDQIDSVRPHHQFPVWQIVLIVSAASLGIVAMVLTAVVWRKKQQKHHLGGSSLVSQVYSFLLAARLLYFITNDATHDSREQDVQGLHLYITSSGKVCHNVSVRASCCSRVISGSLLPACLLTVLYACRRQWNYRTFARQQLPVSHPGTTTSTLPLCFTMCTNFGGSLICQCKEPWPCQQLVSSLLSHPTCC